ncbi:MAG: hypothetical protein A3C79_01420 [Candidatus Taylorbacteria bacterium RIFCSPHIGHO2_02_FULL_45_28]|uniref:HTH iclR-type domain-containing protein n=1 Tax=Candidatus Taylorbacteria bacterium RIFCSPHIGHO2_12_FULL_45_16 TaxID=1802315 RepID=A0A1G2N0X4_9BACT|nr:MAG: hypothetical protein A2830_03585 [Candidatus Taylorbacteria bacterium RIFCSPHIGHO2_01_FULL_44_110]OHA25101.1 MAG: hypothetical protein A3C79_01420 [Candidatus Taylorbacteria bacterium RIFCSPHIGHO2_02_FULL_45_28]OHA28982.1 MAG: hypothetical protein A3F51_01805 [Candidatus Taylorbacteria bacterium RIFCSPHIGHO2_12_FULL_45_16]OHA33100.1 MAG: hypothetical protein A3A23_03485 [Candidatus Taylorbacteria bacterium RIFCSPLOWO2_01_FULL_45_59]OHA39411.1 MAG: hypothetical protein A3I98_02450 [Candi
MYIGTKAAALLGLTPSDVTILKAISSKESAIPDIASRTGVPRTSLYYMLSTLERRSLVSNYERRGKKYWKTSSVEELRTRYTSLFNGFDSLKDDRIVKEMSRETTVTFYRGNSNVINVLREISDLPLKSRFYGIQPEASIIQAVTRNDIKEIIRFNRKINSKKLIVEGIIHEKGTDSMIKVLPTRIGIELLKSFSNRSADTVKLPDNYLNKTKSEIYLYNNKIAIVNWSEEFAVIIQNKDVFDLLKEMFNSTKYLLERYDQNEKIARKLVDFGSV